MVLCNPTFRDGPFERGLNDYGKLSPQGSAFPQPCSTVEPPRREGGDVRASGLLDGATAAREGTRAFQETGLGRVSETSIAELALPGWKP